MRPTTRFLVRVLDARNFANDAYDFENQRTLHRSLELALFLLPRVNAILLDGHADVDPSSLVHSTITSKQPLLLSIAYCSIQLPKMFFNSPYLQNLIYLDISGVSGSILPLLQPGLLPELRVLKVRNREICGAHFAALTSLYGHRLWSLDVSDNRISDNVVDLLVSKWLPVCTQFRSPAHFPVEGKMVVGNIGTSQHGPFISLEESQWSGSFNHPERYFVDAPRYMARPDLGPEESHISRSNGRSPHRQDSAEAASAALSGEFTAAENFRHSHGLTHFHVSNNRLLSAVGIEKWLRISNGGQLESISCDSMLLLPPIKTYFQFWPKGASLLGFIGVAHIFRPVFSSNLRALRIHHSLVTNLPTLELEGLSMLSRLYIAENAILPRVDQAYPQTFIPDMNPRLTSLTLTCIPRRTSGSLTKRLITFLKLLSAQERGIQDSSPAASSWRRPSMLKGLRHLRLEFERDPAHEDVDVEELMSMGDREFSFFEDEREVRKVSEVREGSSSSVGDNDRGSIQSVQGDVDFVDFHGHWNGEAFSIHVWIGKTSFDNTVINDYRRLVLDHNLRDNVGPATPAQVQAGAPPNSYIFHAAWCLATMPQELTPPSAGQLAGMKDVLDDLREFRLQGRAEYSELRKRAGGSAVALGEPHWFWTGRLEVSTVQKERPSQLWR